MNFIGTFWALVPALVAICLALITKEVYSSLFAGILIGALFFSGFSFEGTFNHILNDGLIKVLSDSYNVGIIIFLVILGTLVALMNKGGGSQAFGKWASKNIKSREGAALATWFLGVLIFVDDYFNCLTVGSVMKPVTDKFKISRAKLAYIIDATAAPICIIAPISSWAAAVSGFVEGENGLKLFISVIPYNYYALFTMLTVVLISIMNVNFGPMKEYEDKAMRGDIYGIRDSSKKVEKVEGNGEVIDLVLPVIILVVSCVLGLIYSGGFFKGENDLINSFANSDASVGLVIGSSFTLIIVIIYYIIKGVLPFKSCMDCIIEGFTNMVPAIVILTFAWCLKEMTTSLGATQFVNSIVSESMQYLYILLPCIIFVIGAFISFATGTSWGTFGILIPIVVSIFEGSADRQLMIIGISACMAGAVFGDHCSPISDTTIMSSAGAECNHILHVSTQLPYAVLVAVISFISYYIAASTRNVFFPLIAGAALIYITLVSIKYFYATRRVSTTSKSSSSKSSGTKKSSSSSKSRKKK